MVRYADSPSITITVEVAATPAVLWPLISDIDVPARFSAEFQGAEWIEGAVGPARGARFRGTNEHPVVGRWTTECTVVDCELERSFGWLVGDPDDATATWGFELEPAGSVTLLRMWARMGPGPSGLTPVIEAMPDKEERIVERRLAEWRSNMEATIEGIKATAEEV